MNSKNKNFINHVLQSIFIITILYILLMGNFSAPITKNSQSDIVNTYNNSIGIPFFIDNTLMGYVLPLNNTDRFISMNTTNYNIKIIPSNIKSIEMVITYKHKVIILDK